MSRLPKSSSMIQMDWKGVVPKQFECLVMVPVHVPHEKIEDGQVYHVEESAPPVVGADLLHNITVVRVILPGRLAPLVVAPAPGMTPCLPRHYGLAGQEGGQTHLQAVGGAADGVRGITVV